MLSGIVKLAFLLRCLGLSSSDTRLCDYKCYERINSEWLVQLLRSVTKWVAFNQLITK